MFAKLFDFLVQIFVIERLDHFAFHKRIEFAEIRDHAGRRIHRARHGHFHHVVVPVAIGIVALAVDALIFFFAELRLCRRCEAAKR